jgi:hypothetical protein
VEEPSTSRLAKGPAQRRYIPTQKALHGGEFTGEEEGSVLIGSRWLDGLCRRVAQVGWLPAP